MFLEEGVYLICQVDRNGNPVLNFLGFNFFICHKKPKPNRSTGLFSVFANCFPRRPPGPATVYLSPVRCRGAGVRSVWDREGENE